ncbi:flagellar motor protein MotS [Halobacillus yeomjeoni]|uniref:Flagellar motor protein MotB n=1 Tax=Halobacillus yeomjeoni TaxID=311194 RepID=A0A931MVB7_9BACI|nr:flagellar motor protein MotS [Halobacillus yeomjeoni]MBH0230174.1 flagellar motor protein MotB [Halobacillus yeomjeoni]
MKPRKKKKKSEGSPKWMTTFADMITLILVFFILLFAMSQINIVKFEAIAESFRDRVIFDFYPSPIEQKQPAESDTIDKNDEEKNQYETPAEILEDAEKKQIIEEEKMKNLEKLKQAIDEYLEKNQLNDIITANQTERGIVLILEEKLLFETSEATILDGAKPFLSKVGTLLSNIPNFVKVEGHTDNRQISTYRYPSNWELSGARASSVIRYILSNTDGLDPKRFTAVAYGDTRPVAPNNSEENWSKNRRVEIVILNPEYSNRN